METETVLDNVENLENLFFTQIEETPPDMQAISELLMRLEKIADAGAADNLATLLQDRLIELGATEALIVALELRSVWQSDQESFRLQALSALEAVLKGSDGQALIKNSGFATDTPIADCLRRLRTLTSLKSGTLCINSTWGFGVVTKVDHFYEKVTIDFHKRAGHQISFLHAGESLLLPGEDHLLVILYRDPERVHNLVANEPGELVKMVLSSLGPMPITNLAEFLAEYSIVHSGEWKAFWEAARKVLREDPFLVIPSKRTENLVLLAKRRAFDDEWFDTFSKEKDLETLLQNFSNLAAEPDVGAIVSQKKDILANRVEFFVKGATGIRGALLARFYLLALRNPFLTGFANLEKMASELLNSKAFADTAVALPARDLFEYMDSMFDFDDIAATSVLMELLPVAGIALLPDLLNVLIKRDEKKKYSSKLGEMFLSGTATSVHKWWASANLLTALKWKLETPLGIFNGIIDVMNLKASGEDLKAQNQIEALLSKKEWLSTALDLLSNAERIELVSKINRAGIWDPISKRGFFARLVKLDPSLENAIAADSAKKEPSAAKRITSWRSYKERSEQYRRLIEKEIPENSREIAQARSYGDLRENHEYKAAKEHQAVLLRRKEEMEEDLRNVQGTDFSGIRTDIVGAGTEVLLKHEDGREEKICILGEWDRDEELNIISNRSRMGEALSGCIQGEVVSIPSLDGDKTAEITGISGLSSSALEWLKKEKGSG